MTLVSRDPATEQVIERFEEATAADVAGRLERAAAASPAWAATPLAERTRLLTALAALLRAERENLAGLAAREMGKILRQGAAEVEKCASACEYYAAHAAEMLAPEPAPSDAARSYLRFDPIGPVLAILPWNFPFWQVLRFAAPALAAGNTVLLKHAPNVPRCALALEDLVRRAGAPEGVFQALLVSNETASELIAHPVVRAVTFTGSTRAGAEVAARAGRALKKTVLELGGSDPFLVLADALVETVAREAAVARTQNAGQSCIAAKRFLVSETLADAFVDRLRSALEALRVGDPRAPDTDLGPLARADLVDALDDQVRRSVAQGAKLVCGGARLGSRGYFYAPTLLDQVRPGMPAAEEETFGPVAAVIRVRDDEEAVRIANASRFGLGASVWGSDVARAEALAARIDSGSVFVNGMVRSDPRLPFGGVKQSGWGRELGVLGIREFVNVKTVWVGPAGS